eukprot:68783-Chlamydomonas_euryale.AAC.2
MGRAWGGTAQCVHAAARACCINTQILKECESLGRGVRSVWEGRWGGVQRGVGDARSPRNWIRGFCVPSIKPLSIPYKWIGFPVK